MAKLRDLIFDVYTRRIYKADQKNSFLSIEDLESLENHILQKNRRFDIINRLSKNTDKIVLEASRILFKERKFLVSPGGNAYPNRRMAACLRDMEFLLRYILASFLCSDPSILQIKCLDGLKETYFSLGTPNEFVAESVENMWKVSMKYLSFEEGVEPNTWDFPYSWEVSIGNDYNGTLPECASLYSELKTYFDIAINGVQ